MKSMVARLGALGGDHRCMGYRVHKLIAVGYNLRVELVTGHCAIRVNAKRTVRFA
jgi:hypothetical protein